MSGRESPFKGLESFEDSDHDARLFFGREREREIIVANLLASKLTVLYGDTGVGKSSVLRAGVARDLRALPEPLAVVVFDEWKDDPAGALQERVAAATGAERQSRLVDTLELGAAMMGGEVVVVLDGFEEEFLYHGSDGGPDSFFDQFSEAVTRPGLRASFLVAVREDALAKLDRFKSRVPNVFGNYLRLPHLDRDAGREAILGPVDRYNETADTPVEVEPALVESVLDQVAAGKVELGQAGRGGVDADASQAGIEAPYLQLVMERLWEAETQSDSNVLRLETFERLGGAEQIVRDHLDRALHALGPEQRDVAAAVFNHLVTPSGAKIAHDASDLAGYVGVPESGVAPVLSSLAAQRILRSVPGVLGSEQPRYEIYHDILADPVLAWRTRHESERELERVREAGEKRHRRLLFVAAGAVVLAGAMAVVTIVFVTLRSEADAQAQRAKAQAYDGWALSEIESDPELSLALAAQAATLETTDRVQDVLRKAMIASRVRRVYRTKGPVAAAQFSPDGSQVLVAGGTNARVYDRGSREPRLTISHGPRIVAAGFSPDGKVIFTAGTDGTVRLWSAVDGHRLAVMLRGPAIRTVSFDREGERIAAAGKRIVHVWRVRDGRPVFTRLFPWPVTRVKLSPDGKLLAVIGNHPSVVVYRLPGGEPVGGFAPERLIKGNILKDVAFSPDGTLLATAGRKGGVLVWDVRKAKLLRTLPHKTEVLALAFSPDGKILATAGADGVGRIWNVRNGRLRVALIGHTHYVVRIGFSPNSKYVVTASSDGTARVWDVGGDLLALLAGDSDTVTAASFSPGRARPLQVLTASDDGSARLWDPQTQPRLRKLTKEPGALLRAFSVGHGLLLVAGPGREARLLRTADGHLVRHFRVGGKVVAAAVSKDGRFVAVGAGRTVIVFDRKSGRRVDQIRQPSSVEAVALSPSGDLLGTGGLDGIGRIWTRGSRQPSQFLRGHSAAITAIAFSPDREHVATGSADATTRIWDMRTGGSTHTLKRYQDSNPITSVSFSPDRHGSWLLTSSKGTDVVLWNVETGTQQQLFRWHFGAVSDAAFSPDGRWIVTVGPTTLQLWRPSDRVPLFRLGIAGPGGMTGAAFDSSSRRIFAVAKDGQVLSYRCEVCGRLDELLPIARAQLALTGRKLTRQEQKKFAG